MAGYSGTSQPIVDLTQDGKQPTADEAEIESTWQECLGLGKKSIVLVYQNQFHEAEQALELLAEKAELRAQKFPEEPDARSLQIILISLIGLLRGASRLEKEQINKFSIEMDRAEQLVELGPDWPGKDLNRTGALIILGGIKIGQKSFVSGVWKLLRAVTMLSGGAVTKAALAYEGREKEAIHPFATLVNALAHLVTSGLPAWTKGAASWVLGDTMNRDEGLRLMESLFLQDTMIKPAACGMLLEHYLDHLNKGVMIDRKKYDQLVPELLKYANDEFPDSFLFANVRCIHVARQRQTEDAYGIAEKACEISPEYKGIQLVANDKMALYAVCMLKWDLAANHFRAGLEILKSVDRRAFGPIHALHASLCYIMAGDAASAQEMMDVVREYRKADKKDWGGDDKWAFFILDSAPTEISTTGVSDIAVPFQWRPLLRQFRPFSSLMLKMAPGMQCFSFMTLEAADELIAMLSDYVATSQDECSKIMGQVVLADAYMGLKKYDKVLEICEQALALDKNDSAEEMGASPWLCVSKASASFFLGDLKTAREELTKYSKFPNTYYGFTELSFRATELNLSVDVTFETQYQEVSIKAGEKKNLVTAVPEYKCPGEISWDFTLQQHTISFDALFQPAGGEDWVELQSIKEHDANNGPVIGSFQADQPGKLKLIFDNSSSWARKKTVVVRVEAQLGQSTI